MSSAGGPDRQYIDNLLKVWLLAAHLCKKFLDGTLMGLGESKSPVFHSTAFIGIQHITFPLDLNNQPCL